MLVIIGGHSRSVGKTSITAGLIAALSQLQWTAMKITQFSGDGECANGDPCNCAPPSGAPYAIQEEIDVRTGTDTARFLAAGAQRSYWVRTATGELAYALPDVRKIIEASPHTIVESNSLLQFVRPDLYLAVLDYEVADFKESALRYLDRADAVIVLNESRGEPAWTGVARRLWENKRRFSVSPPHYVTLEMALYVRDFKTVPS
jgi:hypothetical protein